LAFEPFLINLIWVGHLIWVCLATFIGCWCDYAARARFCPVKRELVTRGRMYAVVLAEFLASHTVPKENRRALAEAEGRSSGQPGLKAWIV
jgi:hypothetical protein